MLAAESSEETSQDHDHIRQDGNQDVGTTEISEKREVKQQQRGRQAPVDIASPVDLAVDVLVRGWNMVVLLADADVVVRDAHAGCHGEVGNGGDDGDHGSNDMVETLRLLVIRCGITSGWSCMRRRTTGTGHAIPMKEMEAIIMMTNTTLMSGECHAAGMEHRGAHHSVRLPSSWTCSNLGRSGMTVGKLVAPG